LKISEVFEHAVVDLLRNGDLLIDMHPFVVRIRSDIPMLAEDICQAYPDFSLLPSDRFADFHVEVSYEKGFRRWLKPLARFYFDGRPSFVPLPAFQAFPMLEWGINWCVAAHCHQYLIIHAAVIEKRGHTVVLPAPPGAGKSTLCAALVNRGWRLLSDELALYDMTRREIFGMARPINLKNKSISIIKEHTPGVVMSNPVPDTTKGTVALMKPPANSVVRVAEPGRPSLIVLPNYRAGAQPTLEPYSKAKAFMLVAEQSFNYDVQGRVGFDAVGELVDSCACFQFTYSSLDDAERVFDGFVTRQANV
jgi:HprK-related kinase A